MIKYLVRKDCKDLYVNFSNEIMAEWAQEMKANGLDLVILSLRKIYRYYEDKKQEQSYILSVAMEDLLTLLHEMVIDIGKSKWEHLGGLIPGTE